MKMNKSIAYVITVYVLTGFYSLLYLKFPYGSGPAAVLVTAIYMFMPFIAAALLQKLIYKEPFADMGVVFKWSNWYIFAAIVPVAIVFMTLGISLLMPGVSYDPTGAAFLDNLAKQFPAGNATAVKEKLAGFGAALPLLLAAQGIIAGATLQIF